jgi:hypothetical protein
VRGGFGVGVHVSGGGFLSGPIVLGDRVLDVLMLGRDWPNKAKGGDFDIAEQSLRDGYAALVRQIRAIQPLWCRLFDASGYKHHEPHELMERFGRTDHGEEFGVLFGLKYAVLTALRAHHFAWESRAEFDAWDQVTEHVLNGLTELATRSLHVYEAIAYLNGPLIDEPESIALVLRNASNPASMVWLEYATDERLAQAIDAHLIRDPVSESVQRANAIIRFSIRVPVEAPVESYLDAYPIAAHVVSRVLDVLRIVHAGDIGVGALRVAEVTPYTPVIRRTYAWDYEPEVTMYQARRMAFTVPTDRVITEQEIVTARILLPVHLAGLDQQGFDVAIRRFRDSYERYHPTDTGKLLDIAIALEALLLNDDQTKEVSHRLCVRGARWLETTLPERRETFKHLKWLYALRSRIAHGAVLKSADKAKLAVVLEQAPILLRRAMRRALEGAGPVGLDGDALHSWWRDLELN